MDRTASPPPFLEPIHILGAGSIGLLIGAQLKAAFPGFPICMLLRANDPRRRIQVTVVTDANRPRVVSLNAKSVDSLQHPLKHVLVTTKAISAKRAVDSIRSHILMDGTEVVRQSTTTAPTPQQPTSIVYLGNGALAVQHELATNGYPTVEVGMVTHGAYRQTAEDDDGDGDDDAMTTIVHAGQGRIFLSHNHSLADLLNKAHLNCQHVPRAKLQDVLWLKLAANCVINPLTALHGIRNGEIRALASFPDYLHNAVHEVVQVHRAVMGDSSFDLNDNRVKDFVEQVLTETGLNRSSMLQDVQANRATEIDYLNGYICNQAALHGLDCPTNSELVRLVHERCRQASGSR